MQKKCVHSGTTSLGWLQFSCLARAAHQGMNTVTRGGSGVDHASDGSYFQQPRGLDFSLCLSVSKVMYCNRF